MDSEVVQLYLDDIIPNRFQPREVFDDQALKELAVSIREHGVIQPIIVRKIGDKYEIIAGERRYKASSMAGLTKIPAIIRNLDDKESSKVALIENLQRRDLSPIEEARTYQKILDLDNMTQEELAKTMGKSQSAVSNKLRLLTLPMEVQEALLNNEISERHARGLLNLNNKEEQVSLLKNIISNKMTVRELEIEIKKLNGDDVTVMETVNNQNISNYTNNIDNNNPTVVDINKVKENSIDIDSVNARKKMNIEELLKPSIQKDMSTSEIQQPEVLFTVNKTDAVNESLANINSNATSIASPLNSNSVSELEGYGKPSVFVPSDTTESLYGDNKPINVIDLDSVIPTNKKDINKDENINIPTKGMGVRHATEIIKESIEKVKNEGYKVEFQEFDLLNSYQIVINIEKK